MCQNDVSNDVLGNVLKDMSNGMSNATAVCRTTVHYFQTIRTMFELKNREFGQFSRENSREEGCGINSSVQATKPPMF